MDNYYIKPKNTSIIFMYFAIKPNFFILAIKMGLWYYFNYSR